MPYSCITGLDVEIKAVFPRWVIGKNVKVNIIYK